MTHSSQSANSYPVLELKTPQPRKPLGPEHTGMAGHPETPQEGSGERRKLSSGQVNPLERAGRQAGSRFPGRGQSRMLGNSEESLELSGPGPVVHLPHPVRYQDSQRGEGSGSSWKVKESHTEASDYSLTVTEGVSVGLRLLSK